LLRSTPNSMSVWAEMLTLVAERASPTKIASVEPRPNNKAVK